MTSESKTLSESDVSSHNTFSLVLMFFGGFIFGTLLASALGCIAQKIDKIKREIRLRSLVRISEKAGLYDIVTDSPIRRTSDFPTHTDRSGVTWASLDELKDHLLSHHDSSLDQEIVGDWVAALEKHSSDHESMLFLHKH